MRHPGSMPRPRTGPPVAAHSDPGTGGRRRPRPLGPAALALAAFLAAGVAPAAAHDIDSELVDARTVRYRVICVAGERAFDGLALAGDERSAYTLVAAPPGWGFAPDGDDLRFSGPPLGCPSPPGGHVFELRHAAADAFGQWRVAVTAGGAVLDVGCALGWAIGCEPKFPQVTLCEWVLVVGVNADGPDAAGRCRVNVRDFLGNPIPFLRVEVDFSECCDINLCGVAIPGQEFKGCIPPIVSGFTDGGGDFRFTVVGAGKNPGTAVPPAIWPGAGRGCVAVRAGGVLLGRATAVALDQDGATGAPGAAGVNSLDLAVLKNDIGAAQAGAPYKGRADYSCDGAIDALDLAFAKHHVGRAVVGTGSSGGCPGASYCATKAPGCP